MRLQTGICVLILSVIGCGSEDAETGGKGINPVKITGANFDAQVLKSKQPVLVDFWAVWCGPCQEMDPVIKGIAGEFAGKAAVGKVDVDRDSKLAAKYGITSIPCFLIFYRGEEVTRFTGVTPRSSLVYRLRELVKEGPAD